MHSASLRYRKSPYGSRVRSGWSVWIGAAVLAVILAGGWIGLVRPERPAATREPFWQAGIAVPIAVRAGRATFRVATPRPASDVLVVVSALARSTGPFALELSARPASRAALPELADDGSAATPKRTPVVAPELTECEPAAVLPARERIFHMMVRDGDALSPSNYIAIRGVLRGSAARSRFMSRRRTSIGSVPTS